MWLIYRAGIWIYGQLVRVLSLFNDKAKKWSHGRRGLLKQVAREVDANKASVWFHFASLGEFEQGRPVLEALKSHHPDWCVIITFYSPSGYEIRKNTPLANHVYYLPEDTPGNAKAFIRLINPRMAVFTKYEYWPYYFRELAIQRVPLYVVSAIFRPKQVFFKWYGGLFRQTLQRVTHFFTQNEESLMLLEGLGLTNASLTGDTRFDRVIHLPEKRKAIAAVEAFTKGGAVLVAGSTWPADEQLLAQLHRQRPDWCIVIAPHEIHEEHLVAIEKSFPDAVRLSTLKSGTLSDIDGRNGGILVVDNIGMLSSLYGYGLAAYIGGGFGAGIHNTLEAAAYGIPVIFGPNYQKFQEAKDLLALGGGFRIDDGAGLIEIMDNSIADEKKRSHAGEIAGRYVKAHAGATEMIVRHLLDEQLSGNVIRQ